MNKTKQKKRSKFLFILNTVMLVMLLAIGSITVYGYWAGSFKPVGPDEENGTVEIGQGTEIETTVVASFVANTDTLVPVGHAGKNDTDLQFNVLWSGTGAEGAIGTLKITLVSIEIDGVNKAHLFTALIPADQSITAGTNLPVTINVEFTNEPTDKAEYDAIINKNLIVTLEFEVTPPVTP